MKKLFLLSALCLTSCFLVVGCGNNQDAAVTNLANQIDLLSNTITSVSKTGEEILTLSSLTKEQAINYSGVFQSTKNVINNQLNYKTAILTKNGLIKNKLASKDLKLTNQNSKALTELTSTLSKDTKLLNETKSEFKNSINAVKKSISSNNASTSQVSSKINRLSSCIDSQNCYYKNLLKTLNNIESVLDIDDESFDYNTFNAPLHHFRQIDEKNEDNRKDLEELFYQFMLQQNLNNLNNTKTDNENECKENCNEKEIVKEVPSYNTNFTPNGYYNNAYYGYGYVYGYPYGPVRQNFPYYNYYGFRTNPSRNTDSYRPFATNIDTYRMPANDFNNLNNSYGRVQQVSTTKETNEVENPENKSISTHEDSFSAKPEKSKISETEIVDTDKQNLKQENLIKKELPKSEKKLAEIIKVKNDEKAKSKFAGLTHRADKKLSSANPSTELKLFIDTNKKIENLIRKKTEKAFNNMENFVNLR